MKEENIILKKDIADLQDSIKFHGNKMDEKFDDISHRSNHNNSDHVKYKKITDKVTELEYKSCWNNLWFDRFLEQDDSWEDSDGGLKKLIVGDFIIEEEVVIDIAHRIGKPWKMMNGVRIWLKVTVSSEYCMKSVRIRTRKNSIFGHFSCRIHLNRNS